MNYRIEKDTLGKVKVPAEKYWGAQTERSRNNFKIGAPGSMPLKLIHAYARVKKACAHANHTFHLLDQERASLISQVCDEILSGQHDDQFPLVIWQTGSGTQTNMNLNEVIANRIHVLLGKKLGEEERFVHPNDHVNMSQSSNDTFPTAAHIASLQLLQSETIPAIEALQLSLEEKTHAFDHIVKIGRTHLMDATPITLGQEFSGYAAQLDFGLTALNASLSHLSQLAIGGTAVGTGINAPKGFGEKVVHLLNDQTQLRFVSAPNKYEALAANDALVETHHALKQLAISLMKIANDIRWMGSGPRCGLGELLLPSNEPGSSIMPGKINPTQAEALTMVCARVIGNDAAMTIGGMQGHFELNVFKPMMTAALLESAQLLGDACSSFTHNCIIGLEPNTERIAYLLNNSLMLITALNNRIGYDKAAEIAKYAYQNNTTLKAAALELGHVTELEFDAWVNPLQMTGKSNDE